VVRGAEPRSPQAIARALLVARILLVAYLIGVALVAFWPTPVDRDLHEAIKTLAAEMRTWGIRWLRYDRIEFAANVLFFVPFGALVTWVSGRWWLGILLGVLASATIEIVQGVALPDRFSTLLDVAANSLGAAIGVGLAILVGWATGLRRRRPGAAVPVSAQ
jgi:glycopeptide antibiotics resistance protein